MDSETRNYEIGYLLSPQLKEDAVLPCANKITAMIEGGKGIIRHMEVPRQRRLAYLIEKQERAYFGWVTFSMPAEAILILERGLRSESEILRYTILKQDRRTEIEPARFRFGGVRGATGAKAPLRKEEPSQPLDLETLDKKLEEILGA